MTNDEDERELIDEHELSRYCGLCIDSLRRWRYPKFQPKGTYMSARPKAIKRGRSVLYDMAEVRRCFGVRGITELGKLLTEPQAAHRLGLTVSGLRKRRERAAARGREVELKSYRFGNAIRYRLEDVEKYERLMKLLDC